MVGGCWVLLLDGWFVCFHNLGTLFVIASCELNSLGSDSAYCGKACDAHVSDVEWSSTAVIDCSLVPDAASFDLTFGKGETSIWSLNPRPGVICYSTLNYSSDALTEDASLVGADLVIHWYCSAAVRCSCVSFAEVTACGHAVGLGRKDHSVIGVTSGTCSLVGSCSVECSLELAPILLIKVVAGDYDENTVPDVTAVIAGGESVECACVVVSVTHCPVVEYVVVCGTSTVDIKSEPGADFGGCSHATDETSMLDLLCPRLVDWHCAGESLLSPDK